MCAVSNSLTEGLHDRELRCEDLSHHRYTDLDLRLRPAIQGKDYTEEPVTKPIHTISDIEEELWTSHVSPSIQVAFPPTWSSASLSLPHSIIWQRTRLDVTEVTWDGFLWNSGLSNPACTTIHLHIHFSLQNCCNTIKQ